MVTFNPYPTPMKLNFFLPIVLVCLCPTLGKAQFPEIAQHPATIVQLQSLGSGVRFTERFNFGTQSSGSHTIYNLDLSVHRVLNYPAPPSNMQWNILGYITEELFDTDPSTIEFVMVAGSPSGPGDFATFVFREDGTELFSQNPGSMVASIGGYLLSSNPIFSADGQSYMVLYTNSVFGQPTRIYALPGTLPCMDCYGSPTTSGIGMGGNTVTDPFSGMVLQPNPVQDEVLVSFDKDAAQADVIAILDASGREVMRQRSSSASTSLQVAHLANGTYTVLALRGGERIGSLPLVIGR